MITAKNAGDSRVTGISALLRNILHDFKVHLVFFKACTVCTGMFLLKKQLVAFPVGTD
jgi:hypothetical protein